MARRVPLKLCVGGLERVAVAGDGQGAERPVRPVPAAARRCPRSGRRPAGRSCSGPRDHTPEALRHRHPGRGRAGPHGGAGPAVVGRGEGGAGGGPQGAGQGGRPARRPPAVQDGRRGPGVRLPERGRRGPARAPGGGGALPVGRPARSSPRRWRRSSPGSPTRPGCGSTSCCSRPRRCSPRPTSATWPTPPRPPPSWPRSTGSSPGLKGNGRLDRARAYVKDQLRKLKLASIEAI